MKRLSLFCAFLTVMPVSAATVADLDHAYLAVRPGAAETLIPVARLWECFAQSASQSKVIERTPIESYSEAINLRVVLQNSDGKRAELYFTLEQGIAFLYRISTQDGVLRKHENIAALLTETCDFKFH